MIGPLGLSPFEAITHVPSGKIYVWLPEATNETDGVSIFEEMAGRGRWVRVSFLTAIPSLLNAARDIGVEWTRSWAELEAHQRKKGPN